MRRLMAKLQVNPLASIPIACQDSEIQANLKHANIPTSADLHLSCDNQGAIKLLTTLSFTQRQSIFRPNILL
ncbi:hypothetical protein Mp_4g02410 [Marchantia polymorpha subsp. ruderalis]|uniref:Uncharacterized protein n=2 Tax=Marchantia polymorpha TaxID=3197 RepID=A0AAF6B5H8_MARPO|nr:hypothetical protein MARPO_0080s0057 [Marchantia polymorpha]BBN07262.1 hypothetical protein Mp_4g02410 [Marchantia polymorpha subsp. ruderalis]|eukprot:PTQ34441.1 hypothetical protein MARPO_0080s0057 [Marchantia polymorpha]